jgi:hypothetical protein
MTGEPGIDDAACAPPFPGSVSNTSSELADEARRECPGLAHTAAAFAGSR